MSSFQLFQINTSCACCAEVAEMRFLPLSWVKKKKKKDFKPLIDCYYYIGLGFLHFYYWRRMNKSTKEKDIRLMSDYKKVMVVKI